MVCYKNYWPGFDPKEHIFHYLFQSLQCGRPIEVVGPFKSGGRIKRFGQRFYSAMFPRNKADFFITGENRRPQFHRAKKQIGFWRSYSDRDDVFRFPYWMWHLDWPELTEVPDYPRYGMPLSIDRLMRPICETYSVNQLLSRLPRAVLFSMHLREPRQRFYQLTSSAIGCDGFGGAFGNDNREQPKMPVMERYRFSLCPENQIGDGYITEKIPESFHSGCIPIAWCRPDDLQVDFNPKAVINLYGLDHAQVNEVLIEVASGGCLYSSLIKEPLLLKRPTLTPLIRFISGN